MRRLAAAALVGLLGLPAPGWAAVTVRVWGHAEVHGDRIRLGDVASVEGSPALARRLGEVELGLAPPPGEVLRVDPAALRLRVLEQAAGQAREVRLDVPAEIVVSRPVQVVPGAALVEAAARAVRERLAGQAPEARWALVPLGTPPDLRLPTGTLELAVQVQPAASPGFAAATVVARVGGRDRQAVPVSFRVGRQQAVVVAARPLPPRAPLAGGDLVLDSRPSTEVPAGALTAMPDLRYLEPARALRAGEVVSEGLLRPRLLVRRGDLVTVLVDGPGFSIRTQARALADGHHREAVALLNGTSRRQVEGRVEGPGLVRVPFGTAGGAP